MRGTVVITSWTAARISWPRCQAVGVRGSSGILLDDELARAVRTEAAAAVCYHWGVIVGVVWRRAHGEREGVTVALRSLKCPRKPQRPLPIIRADCPMTNYKLPDAGEQRDD